MASATGTGIPQRNGTEPGVGEDEPLLGRAGDASQPEGKPLYYNLIIGTAVITQFGAILFIALIWADVLLVPLQLFTAHPLLNSFGILVLTQGILILQPTHTAEQKRAGTIAHFSLNAAAIAALVAGLVVIEVNKVSHNGTHFKSPHAILGLATYLVLLLQSLVGFTQYFTPALFGSVANAKSIYKYHRASGYVVLILLLVTVGAATYTTYNINALHIKLWSVVVTSILILLGILPRIKKQKFGL